VAVKSLFVNNRIGCIQVEALFFLYCLQFSQSVGIYIYIYIYIHSKHHQDAKQQDCGPNGSVGLSFDDKN
jgi:hypothetical protein